jgi:hypothetical protein
MEPAFPKFSEVVFILPKFSMGSRVLRKVLRSRWGGMFIYSSLHQFFAAFCAA